MYNIFSCIHLALFSKSYTGVDLSEFQQYNCLAVNSPAGKFQSFQIIPGRDSSLLSHTHRLFTSSIQSLRTMLPQKYAGDHELPQAHNLI